MIEQVYNRGKTSIVQDAWAGSGGSCIHGWVFDLQTGYIRALTSMIDNDEAMREVRKFHPGAAHGSEAATIETRQR